MTERLCHALEASAPRRVGLGQYSAGVQHMKEGLKLLPLPPLAPAPGSGVAVCYGFA